MLHETHKSMFPFNTCWFSISRTHFLADLQVQSVTFSSCLSPPLQFAARFTPPRCSRSRPPLLRSALLFSAGGEGRGKGITLSLDVCFRWHFREIWSARHGLFGLPRRTSVHECSATHRKTNKRHFGGTFFTMYDGPGKSPLYLDAVC